MCFRSCGENGGLIQKYFHKVTTFLALSSQSLHSWFSDTFRYQIFFFFFGSGGGCHFLNLFITAQVTTLKV